MRLTSVLSVLAVLFGLAAAQANITNTTTAGLEPASNITLPSSETSTGAGAGSSSTQSAQAASPSTQSGGGPGTSIVLQSSPTSTSGSGAAGLSSSNGLAIGGVLAGIIAFGMA